MQRWIDELQSGEQARMKAAAMGLRYLGPSAKPALGELRSALSRVDAMRQAVMADGSTLANAQAADSIGEYFKSLEELDIVLRAAISDLRDW